MIRKIVKINEELCNGCSLCADACHEGAIKMLDGKAKLIRDDYCDGLGDCLPVCPTGAITFEEREALAYDEAAVKKNIAAAKQTETLPCGCPGTNSKTIERQASAPVAETFAQTSKLRQWPVQIKLVPVNAPYFDNADLLIAADCTAFAYGDFHKDFIAGKIAIIGCPKLDEGDYSEKLTAILKNNNIKSLTIVRMEVPCCTGIENAAKNALKNCDKLIPWGVKVISLEGKILS